MAITQRTRSKLPGPGPFLAEITNHLDKTLMGGLEVVILQHTPAGLKRQSDTYPVKYLSPFYGVTSARFQGNDSSKFDDSQKSYGMWMVPPDVGTTVMVIFVNSDPNQGYWIGCVPDLFQNQMVPGIAAAPSALASPAEKAKYLNAGALPVAEYNKKVFGVGISPESASKPVHPFANVLLNQGLLLDTVRGVTSSSARRERPSKVFGISTPGPVDNDGPTAAIGYSGDNQIPVSRLGGTTFVMDDGDINGENELVRIRTRTGHQILLHNTSDLIYIANAKGTAWLEFTSSGKVDIYAADSVSIHTEGDFNLKADRDFNLEAGRNFNVLAESLRLVGRESINLSTNDLSTAVQGDYSLEVDGDSNIKIVKSSVQVVGDQITMTSNKSMVFTATEIVSVFGKEAIEIDSVMFKRYANSRSKQPEPVDITTPESINLFALPKSTIAGAEQTPFLSSMQRVPMHEPWSQHEDINPPAYTLDMTDSTIGGAQTGSVTPEGTASTSNDDYKQSMDLIDKIKKAFHEKFGKVLPVTSGPRTRAKQQSLYDAWSKGAAGIYTPVNPAKYPGAEWFHLYSMDISPALTSEQEAWMKEQGWARPPNLKVVDPVHYVYIPAGGKARSSGGAAATNGGVAGSMSANAPVSRTQSGVDTGTLQGVGTPWSTDKAFLTKVKKIAGSFKFEPVDLLACINFESARTFDPSKRNESSSATGLIQFLEATIAELSGGTVKDGEIIKPGSVNTEALAKMSRLEQLDWVEKYFKKWGWPNSGVPKPTLSNIYLTIFLPAAASADDNARIASTTFRPKAYYANKAAFDKGNIGYFTPAMVAKFIEFSRLDVIKTLEITAKLGPDLEPLK